MVFEGGFYFLKTTVIFDPIDRIWIFGGFQPSVHSGTASTAIFYLWVWKMTFFVFENPGILSTPGWLYACMYVRTYTCIYIYIHINVFTCIVCSQSSVSNLCMYTDTYIVFLPSTVHTDRNACLHVCMCKLGRGVACDFCFGSFVTSQFGALVTSSLLARLQQLTQPHSELRGCHGVCAQTICI